MPSKREEFMEAIAEHVAAADTDYLAANITDNIRWSLVGSPIIQGKANFLKAIATLNSDGPPQLAIDNIISHGTDVAVNGTLTWPGKIIAFCDIYKLSGFKNAKVSRITSYRIAIEES